MTLILDPEEVASAERTELDLQAGGLEVRKDPGPDFGDAEIQAFIAQQTYGAAMIDYTLPPRTIKIPLRITGDTSAAFDDLRYSLAAKCSRINEKGGWLKKATASGRVRYADLFQAKLHLDEGWFAENRDVDLGAELELMALPDFYGDPVVLESFEGTGHASDTFQILGDLPGRFDMTVEELATQTQMGLAWFFRSRNYSSAATANWALEAEALDLKVGAEKKALTGAGGGEAVYHPRLSGIWTPVVGTAIGGSEYLTHAGLYDTWARVYTTDDNPPWLRFVYDVGDLINPEELAPVQIPASDNFYLVNLGQINLPRLPFGTHRWDGTIQAYTEEEGLGTVYVDRLYFLCADESSGLLSGTARYVDGAEAVARDNFLQAGGALAGKIADTGQTWAGAGDATDFEVVA